MDPALESFAAASREDADAQLGHLLDAHASPVVRRVIAHRLGAASSDADDVHAQVLMQLMVRLRHARVEQTLAAIGVLTAYVATAAHHGCDHYLRAKYPLRWQLRNRIRYAIEHDGSLALWKSAHGVWLCGCRGWQSRPSENPPAVADAPAAGPQQMKAFLTRLFQQSGGPLELAAVVDLAAAVWGVPLLPAEDASALEQLSDRGRGADAALVHRQIADDAWQEIRALPVRQRQALLLHLTDDALSVFMTSGTASLRTLAAALDMELTALASLWDTLPLPDNAIAARLGCTRQQVINLRMAARKRLSNRLARTGLISGSVRASSGLTNRA